MPIKREFRKFYGRQWRTVTRPAILLRAGGRFSEDGKYHGAAKCEKCGYIDCLPKGRSELDVAHLVIPPGDPGHDDHTNLAARCHACHRAHDYAQWAAAYRAWLTEQVRLRIERKDAERPILIMIDPDVAEARRRRDEQDAILEAQIADARDRMERHQIIAELERRTITSNSKEQANDPST